MGLWAWLALESYTVELQLARAGPSGGANPALPLISAFLGHNGDVVDVLLTTKRPATTGSFPRLESGGSRGGPCRGKGVSAKKKGANEPDHPVKICVCLR